VEQVRSTLICVVNNERTIRGLPALIVDARLQAASQKTVDGSSSNLGAGERINAEGYDWAQYARLGAFLAPTVFELVQTHLAIQEQCFYAVLAPEYIDIGVGFSPDANGDPVWEQIFARESSDPPPAANTGPQESCPEALLGNYGAAEAPPVANAAPRTNIAKAQFVKFVSPGKKVRAKFVFVSSEPGSTFRCRMDARPFAKCSSPKTYGVGIGRHTFRVRALDASGKPDPTPAKLIFKILRKR